jgi:hypothetical protein
MIGFHLLRRRCFGGKLARYLGIPWRAGGLSSWRRQVVRRPATQARINAAARRWRRWGILCRRAALEFAKTLARDPDAHAEYLASLSTMMPNVAEILGQAERPYLFIDNDGDDGPLVVYPPRSPYVR